MARTYGIVNTSTWTAQDRTDFLATNGIFIRDSVAYNQAIMVWDGGTPPAPLVMSGTVDDIKTWFKDNARIINWDQRSPWEPTHLQKKMDFDGVDDKLLAADNTVNEIGDISNGMTLYAQVNPHEDSISGSPKYAPIMFKRELVGNKGFILYLNEGRVHFQVVTETMDEVGEQVCEVFTAKKLNAGVSQSIVAVFPASGAAADVKIYVNKIEYPHSVNAGHDLITSDFDMTNTGTFEIGGIPHGGAGIVYWKGSIDRVAGFNTALTKAEADELGNLGMNGEITSHSKWVSNGQFAYNMGALASDDATSSTGQITDVSSNNNHLIPTNTAGTEITAHPVITSFDKMVSWDTSGGADFGTNAIFNTDGSEAISVSMWFLPYLTGAGTCIFAKTNAAGSRGYELRGGGGHRFTSYWFDEQGDRMQVQYEASTIVPDILNHLVYTYDGSKTAAGNKLYLNNVLLPTNPQNGSDNWDISSTTVNSSFKFYMGLWDGQYIPFKGLWKSFGWYKGTELSAADVATLYNNGVPANETGLGPGINLSAYYIFGNDPNDDSTATTGVYNDQIGTADGTPIGTVATDIASHAYYYITESS